MVTVNDVKNGANLDAPIYCHKPYIVLGKEGTVVSSGTLDHIKSLWNYYDDCEVLVRQHDLYLNNNKKIADQNIKSLVRTL